MGSRKGEGRGGKGSAEKTEVKKTVDEEDEMKGKRKSERIGGKRRIEEQRVRKVRRGSKYNVGEEREEREVRMVREKIGRGRHRKVDRHG